MMDEHRYIRCSRLQRSHSILQVQRFKLHYQTQVQNKTIWNPPTMSTHNVYLVTFSSPTSSPNSRTEVSLFVETSPNGDGFIHAIHASSALPNTSNDHRHRYQYIRQFQSCPKSPFFSERKKIGVTSRALYPALWDACLSRMSFSVGVDEFCSLRNGNGDGSGSGSGCFDGQRCTHRPLHGEDRVSKGAVKCTQWTLDRAIPLLRKNGLLKDGLLC